MNARLVLRCAGTTTLVAAAWTFGLGADGTPPTAQPHAATPTPSAAGASTAATSGDAGRHERGKIRQREGTKLSDRRGRFERRGDRYVFLSDDDAAHYLVLENLMLERVANVLSDAAGGQLSWSIDASATEFRGTNYLLLQRAVVKSTHDVNEPRRLGDPLADSKPRSAEKR